MAKESATKKPLWFIFLLLSTQFILVLSLTSREHMVQSFERELTMMESVYGVKSTNVTYEKAVHDARALYVDSGFMKKLNEMLIPIDYRSGTLSNEDILFNVWLWVSNIIENGLIGLSYALVRLYSFSYWIPIGAVLLTASILTGYLLREIKKQTFEYSSPLRFGLCQMGLYFSPILFYILLFLPFALHPFLYVGFIVLVALSISGLLANTIKRI